MSDNPQDDSSVVIALLDTGISTLAVAPEHILQGWNYVTDSEDTEDRINHGTAVASVIVGSESAGVVGLAPEAMLLPMVVLDKEDDRKKSISAQQLAQVIMDCVDVYGADIINVSLGIHKDHKDLQEAVKYAETNGVLIISAVGNHGDSGEYYYPASYDTAVAVGSHDENGSVSRFSQKNGTANLLAPGEDIWLASREGKTYGSRGTSYATSYVTAAAANILIENPDFTPEDVRQMLYQTAIDILDPGYDADSGWGILNRELYQ